MANKKVYFAGSIRGGRVDADLYRRLIAYIQRTDTVLTEHVGKNNLNLMGECTCPSLGVGYELAYAEAHGIPCHIFYDSTKTQLSAMLTGNPYFHIHPYTTEADIYPLLDQILMQ